MGTVYEADGYRIHYKGWNARYDETVKFEDIDARMHKGTLEDYAAKYGVDVTPTKSKKKSMKAATPGAPGSSVEPVDPAVERGAYESHEGTPTSSRASGGRSSKKDKEDSTPYTAVPMVVHLTSPLKKILIDDNVLNNKGYITKIPAKFTIDQIITDYIKTIPVTKDQLQNVDDVVVEYDSRDVSNLALVCTARALVDYFNVIIGYHLLYKIEREQFHDLVKQKSKGRNYSVGTVATMPDNGFRASSEYGFIHLLRMMAKLPDLLKLTQWNAHLCNRIMIGVHDFVVFLNKNHAQYYGDRDDYETKTVEYFQRMADSEQSAAEGADDQPSTSASTKCK
ncbi:hypothetical protein GCK72_010956 [Caenorhabditis remanei]|uniref:MRG domain-containing protein n=1 Tax=Caenorhabditis remanei TaxID=31234 RepID=A0A6A5H7D5_CAERE|nr:hypothetical protein GCK72_010956 [Caenorhabditis remanei]KAF1762694.1 hypothetical protein GCK72_010956 [Caenorhabditis remanei]